MEALPRLLSRAVPAEIATIIAERHHQAGVTIVTGIPIAAIDAGPDSGRLRLADGRVLEADLLVAGIGSIPVTALATEAGLEINNGIAVDDQLATADPTIFAAGDCCSFPLPIYGNRRVRLESWRSAQDHGSTAARNMLGAGAAHVAIPWFWSDQYDLSLQIAGLADEGPVGGCAAIWARAHSSCSILADDGRPGRRERNWPRQRCGAATSGWPRC